ncbi:MAG: protein-export chaperone SecB, partial [Rhodospirillales bacterium]|nr:protein-export chaperone SecB [Rhodospirillales bacterium]
MADDDNPIPAERFTEDPEEAPPPGEAQPQEGGEALVITGQYVRDLSFEAPNAPEVFTQLQTEMPNIPISIDLGAEPKGGNNFEVLLKVRAEATVGETTAYIAEIAYAGLFQINVPQEHLGPVLMIDWGSEGGAALLPSGRVFATMRYQRQPLPSDTEAMYAPLAGGEETVRTHLARFGSRPEGYKNVFAMESADGGLSWTPPRMLCTVYGQTFGYPAAQSDGTVVVIHDTRYGPGPAGARALVSRDEGQTWEDEVYYMDFTRFTGSYSASVVMDDDTILS